MTDRDLTRSSGRLIVISAPSGAGKTSLVRALLESDESARFSTSYTTRTPRPGEMDGTDYIFVSSKKFAQMVENGEFLEHATVFDHCYGTSRSQVETLTAAGHDVILEIDQKYMVGLGDGSGKRALRPERRVSTVIAVPGERSAIHC